MFEVQKDLKKNSDESRVALEEKEKQKEQVGRALVANP